MDVDVKVNVNQIEIDKIKFQKMLFLNTALENGWTIKKRNKSYIFTKNHENRKEIFDEAYLGTFVKEQTDMNRLLS